MIRAYYTVAGSIHMYVYLYLHLCDEAINYYIILHMVSSKFNVLGI